MPEDLELSVHSDQPADTIQQWGVSQYDPTTLIVFPPGEKQPTVNDITQSIANTIEQAVTVVDQPTDPQGSALWVTVLHVPNLPHHLLVWCEPAQQDESIDSSLPDCQWVLGFQMPLVPAAPVESFALLVRLVAMSFPGAPALLDVTTGMIHPRAFIDREYLDPSLPPPAEALFTIHALAPHEECESDHTTATLQTVGLLRAGRPELRMNDVPAERCDEAAALLSNLASLILDDPPPQPGGVFELGPELRVRLAQDSQDTAASIAVVTGESDSSWPHDVLDHLASGKSPVARSARHTLRRARRARATWPELMQLVEALRAADAAIAVKAPLGVDAAGHDDAPREHLWFEFIDEQDDDLRLTLVTPPAQDSSRAAGDQVTVPADWITDWEVSLPAGRFDPDHLPQLRDALEQGRD